MSGHISSSEAAQKWGLERRRVNTLCSEGRITGAQLIGRTWVIPADAKKPADARIKSGKYIKKNSAEAALAALPAYLSDSFKSLLIAPELMLQIFDSFPTPIEIFSPDGMTIYANRALMEFHGQTDPDLLVGKYNLLHDPVCDEIFGRDFIERMFCGEFVSWTNKSVPIQNLVDRGVVEEKPFEAAYIDVHSYPVRDGDTLVYLVCVFIVKSIYQGRAEMIKAQKYIEENWLADFDIGGIAKAANMSVQHFKRRYKQHMGITPHEQYKNIKIEKIKEKLRDPSLNVTQAFAACGVDSKGSFFRLFKETVMMTPSEYREQNLNK